MTRDRNAILTLCSRLCVDEGIRPLSPGEYSALAVLLTAVQKTPGDLFDFSKAEYASVLNYNEAQTERLFRLMDRSSALQLVLGQYQAMGIGTVTQADPGYPEALNRKPGCGAPPVFYYAGDLSLLERPLVGYVGSRNITPQDMEFGIRCVRKTTELGWGVVSGGARGVDTVCATAALQNGGVAVEYLAESLLKKLKKSDVIKNVQQGKLLMMSVAEPDMGFRVSIAMMRNRYIYAQSAGTVVIRSDLGKGGTWTGASDSLAHGRCPVLCWDHPYPGNQALIQKGAIPIDENWDGRIPPMHQTIPEEAYTQTSIFDSDR